MRTPRTLRSAVGVQHLGDVGVESPREGVGQHLSDGVTPALVVDPQPVPGRSNEFAFQLVGGVRRHPDLLDAFGLDRGPEDPRLRRPGEPGRPGRGLEGLGSNPSYPKWA